jgi:hypothetical protein
MAAAIAAEGPWLEAASTSFAVTRPFRPVPRRLATSM